MGRTKVAGVVVGLGVLMCVLVRPVQAAAQATTASGIAGVARDTSAPSAPR